MSEPVNILLPVGRLVGGDCYTPRTKDKAGNPLTIKSGPNQGQARVEFGLGVAIKKTSAAWWGEPWGAIIYQAAAAANATAVASAIGELQAGRDAGKFFAFKIVDGDSQIPNEARRKPCDQEGYPGHWVLWLSGSYAPRIVTGDGKQPIIEPGVVKRGHFVQAYISVKFNDRTDSPGIYLNHGYVAHSGYGPEITSGPDPTTLGFGGPLPPGASPVPLTAMTPPALPGAPLPAAGATPPPVVLPAVPGAPAPAPVAIVPQPAILQAAALPPPPPVVVVPPAAPADPVLTAKAPAGVTYAQMKGAGWSDDQMRQYGYLT